MGKSIQKKNFGAYNVANEQLILASAWLTGDGSATANCKIVRQKGSRRYIVATQAGAKSTVCKLVDGAPAAAGEAQLNIVLSDSSAKNVLKLTQHRAYYGNGSGAIAGSVKWTYTAAVAGTGEIDHA